MSRSSPKPSIERLVDAEVWIQSNSDRLGTLKVGDVAKGLKVCYKTLHQAMNDHGVSFGMFKRNCVLERAREIIGERPGVSLAEAGKLMGFKTKNAFAVYLYSVGTTWSQLATTA